ncbi:MAG: LamG domain-containing protein, partial [Candidatus Pacebacteria bacterium]|nr:LamG domain-containing protein [Candidatus Paceibacterota bacterium]
LAFDGTDDYVDCGNGANLKPTTALTIGLWIKPNNPIGGVGYDRFITRADAAGSSANNSYSFQFYSTTGRLNFAIWIDGDTAVKNLYGNAILTAGNWYYIVGTYDGSYLRIYLNGNLDCTPMSQTGNIRAGTYNFLIGACTGLQSTTMYGGLIDDVRIYNAAIPASQIQQNYYSGLNRLLAGNGINQEEFMERVSQLESSVGKN